MGQRENGLGPQHSGRIRRKAARGLAKCYWKVRVWDADDRPSRWSEPARWSMGPLCEEDWGGAEWIAARDEETWRNEWAEHKRCDVENREPNTWPWFVGTAGRSGTCTRTPRPATILRL